MPSANPYSLVAGPTFGRDAAQFDQLVGLLATVSLVLWAGVIVTMLIRVWYVWYRQPSSRPTDKATAP